MADIKLKLNDLEIVAAQLSVIVEEFENASENSDELEDAIGDPFDRNELRKKASNFEDRWSNKRKQLTKSLAGIRDHVQAVVEGAEEWDSDTAMMLSSD